MEKKETVWQIVSEICLIIVVLIIFIGIGFRFKYIEENCEITQYYETNVIKSVELTSVIRKREKDLIKISGTITDNPKMDYWFYDNDGMLRPGSVPKSDTRLVYIGKNETPHMDTLIITTTTVKVKKRFFINRTKKETTMEQSNEIYVFYVPEWSISE